MEKADDLIKSLTESPEQETATDSDEEATQAEEHEDTSSQGEDSESTPSPSDEEKEESGQETESKSNMNGESSEIPSLPKRLGLSNEETLLFKTIIDGISNATNGKDTDEFAKIYDSIKESLIYKYE
jgi:hypothetical protein